MPPLGRVDDAPPAFQRAVESLRSQAVRPEVVVEDIPAPQRLAPHSVAMTATVHAPDRGGADDDDAAFGRLIVLYDPDDTRDWPGPFRVVAYVSADLEPEISIDPLLGRVAWSWLTDALADRGAGHHTLSGTVTRATTEGFAAKSEQPTTTELELRASWTPTGDDLAAHMAVWVDLLASAGGLPPVDVTDISRRSRSES
ncbi:Protein of unknown function (DUF3000) [Murinocardiopsis flavida]|uniref:DUF3000 family protein n=1 Tax=Murinocardiopsis flavida TaxID=645275 RepID=A0A2P8DLS8_9ACTN|nr:DUF3000 domain-containing protein [Murinocardiopsis flavida]PSK98190.1 Protein of unknown function (DUF3000) [Murinocardiopsis flavida]